MSVIAESQTQAAMLQSLIPKTVELGLSDAAGELASDSAAQEMALSEIGDMAMSVKQIGSLVAAAVLLTVGLGGYGLTANVSGQESGEKVEVQAAKAENPFGSDVKVPARIPLPRKKPRTWRKCKPLPARAKARV